MASSLHSLLSADQLVSSSFKQSDTKLRLELLNRVRNILTAGKASLRSLRIAHTVRNSNKMAQLLNLHSSLTPLTSRATTDGVSELVSILETQLVFYRTTRLRKCWIEDYEMLATKHVA